MDVIYGLIPGMIVLGLIMVGVLFWAARSGQFEDLEGDAHRILMDDDIDQRPKREQSHADAQEKNFEAAPMAADGIKHLTDSKPARRGPSSQRSDSPPRP